MKKIKSYYLPEDDQHYPAYFKKFDHYQEAQRNRALAHVKNWNLAIDIGANIGLWSRDLTNFFDKTICFEPNTNCIECLKKNIIEDKAVILNFALGSELKESELFTPKDCGGSSFINKTKIGIKFDGLKIYGKYPKETKTQIVKVKKLDDFNYTNIDFIKIDVEGYESEVLIGATKTLENNSPTICMEEHNPQNTKSIKFLLDLNYKIVDQIGKEYIFTKN